MVEWSQSNKLNFHSQEMVCLSPTPTTIWQADPSNCHLMYLIPFTTRIPNAFHPSFFFTNYLLFPPLSDMILGNTFCLLTLTTHQSIERKIIWEEKFWYSGSVQTWRGLSSPALSETLRRHQTRDHNISDPPVTSSHTSWIWTLVCRDKLRD